MTNDIPPEPLCGDDRVPPDTTIREDARTLSRIVLTTATAVGGLMGLVAYWIG
jgi:hypothetical protein